MIVEAANPIRHLRTRRAGATQPTTPLELETIQARSEAPSGSGPNPAFAARNEASRLQQQQAMAGPVAGSQPKVVDQLPAELVEIWGRMDNHGNVAQELGELADRLVAVVGEEAASVEFHRILTTGYKTKDWTKLPLEKQKQFARDLWTSVRAAEQRAQPDTLFDDAPLPG